MIKIPPPPPIRKPSSLPAQQAPPIKKLAPRIVEDRPGWFRLQPNKVWSSEEEMKPWLEKQYPEGFEIIKTWNSISCEVWVKEKLKKNEIPTRKKNK